MTATLSKICALALVLSMVPGAFEILENATHLLSEGHLAHVAPAGDHHSQPGTEHGCSPIFHSCACHASVSFLGAPATPTIRLRAAGRSISPDPEFLLVGFWPSVDRPPRV